MAAQADVDGGWGWAVVGGAFTIQMFFGCVLRGFGVLYLRLLVRFSASANATSWVGTSMLITLGVTGPLGGWLMQRFSCRLVAMLGSAIMGCGIIATGLVNSLTLTYVSFGTAGLGLSLCYNASFVIIDKYFIRKKACAMGLSTLGTAVGMFVFPPVMDVLFRTYGFTGGLLLFGGVALQGCVASALFFPMKYNFKTQNAGSKAFKVSEKTHNGKHNAARPIEMAVVNGNIGNVCKSTNIKTMTSGAGKAGDKSGPITGPSSTEQIPCKINNSYSMEKIEMESHGSSNMASSGCSSLCGNPFLSAMIIFTFSQFYAGYCTAAFAPALALEKMDISIEQASLSVTLFGATDAISKALAAICFDLRGIRRYRTFIFAGITLMSAFSILILPFVRTYPMFLAMCALFGMFHGVPGGQRATILSDMVEPDQMPSAIGIMMLPTSLGCVTSGISAGVLRDHLGTYSVGFYISSLFVLLSSIILFVLLGILKPRTWRTKAGQVAV